MLQKTAYIYLIKTSLEKVFQLHNFFQRASVAARNGKINSKTHPASCWYSVRNRTHTLPYRKIDHDDLRAATFPLDLPDLATPHLHRLLWVIRFTQDRPPGGLYFTAVLAQSSHEIRPKHSSRSAADTSIRCPVSQ